MAPTYPFDATIKSNVVPPSKVNQADIGHLPISFLRIQFERSSSIKKILIRDIWVTEVGIVRLCISCLSIQVRGGSLQEIIFEQ